MRRLGSRFQSVIAHERALAALRDISERAPFAAEPARDEDNTNRSIQLLDDGVASRQHRRGAPARAEVPAGRKNAAKHDRPTIASIPTVGWRPAPPAETTSGAATAS